MMGPAPYDLVNLLDDARRMVPDALREECLGIYTSSMSAEDRESFLAWYPVLATQFHCRVIGQAIRLAIRDKKERLLSIIPILRRHLLRDLSSPTMAPLKQWFDEQGLFFNETNSIDLESTKKLIRGDAF